VPAPGAVAISAVLARALGAPPARGAIDGRRRPAYPVAQGGGSGAVGGTGERETTTGPGAPRELPAGTVAFLFTDLEGSTALLAAHPTAYREAVRRHHELLLEAVEARGGAVFETVGDAVCAAFARPAAGALGSRTRGPSTAPPPARPRSRQRSGPGGSSRSATRRTRSGKAAATCCSGR
jgi:class 3 adenylate cyclase